MSKRRFALAAPAKDAVSYDPVDCLMLWLVVLDEEESQAALEPLGVDKAEVDRLKRNNPELVARMKKLRIAGRLLVRGKLAMLLRARLGEELMRCTDARGIAQLTTAMSRMALWMFWMPVGPELDKATNIDRLNGLLPNSADELPKLRMGS